MSPYCQTLDKSVNLFVPQFPISKMGILKPATMDKALGILIINPNLKNLELMENNNEVAWYLCMHFAHALQTHI